MKARIWGAVAGVLCAGAAWADEVHVVADIAPVHSIVARVMEGVATPDLIVKPGESPHDFALRPSTARALQQADVVFWMGPALLPSLEKPLETVAENSRISDLSDVQGTVRHEFRETAGFAASEHHDHENKHDNEHGHEESHDAHDDHEGDDHAHEGLDPHMWLDPENAEVWAAHIATVLSAADPGNTEVYQANADQLIKDVHAVTHDIQDMLKPVAGQHFVVFHDAYQYFEHRFGLRAAGSILISDASAPSAARLAEIEHVIEDQNVHCVFVEPQFDPRLVKAVAARAKTGEIDPMGVELTLGGNLYLDMLRGLAQSVSDCLRD
ncbi:zinc ABC transporter substrate-binding protein [Shimia sediminis]|uniref:zinc ABC transporter substrate-binding protein n=1 Tax=Shimia sediminis TaxID=2497945 RepID=UPI000F8C3B61|nr:zinc ABC transporter substrate-binding protein [Shimia sediminis]